MGHTSTTSTRSASNSRSGGNILLNVKRVPKVEEGETSDATKPCSSSLVTISSSPHPGTEVSLTESPSIPSSSTDSDPSSLGNSRKESNIASYIAYPTRFSASTSDVNLFPASVGDPDGLFGPLLFVLLLELRFSAHYHFVSAVDLLAFLGLRRSNMTRGPALISFPLAPRRVPLAPEHCHVLVCGNGMADKNLCYLDATEFYTIDEANVDLSVYAFCDPLRFPLSYWYHSGTRPVFLVMAIIPSAQAYFSSYKRYPRAP